MRSKIDFHIIANAARGPSMSGGDRIFIECSRRWAEAGHKVHVYVWEEGHEMCKRNNLKNVDYIIWKAIKYKKLGNAIFYLARTIRSCIEALRAKSGSERTIIYSASDFWPDSITGFLMSRKMRRSKWVASFLLFIPNPFSKQFPYKGKEFLKGLAYYFSQLLAYLIVKKYSDIVIVFGGYDVKKFITEKRGKNKILAIGGGVDTKTSMLVPVPKTKKYDAVFLGRLHIQKGVMELIDIWKHVCEEKKNSKLAIIGIGELEGKIREKIKKYNMGENFDLLGFKDGVEKIKIFKESKMVLYPAILNHWSISPVEAMTCGLPLVTFDLPVLKSYPSAKGMIRVPRYNLKAFAESIIKLMDDKKLCTRLMKEAKEWAREWDWDKKAEEILENIEED